MVLLFVFFVFFVILYFTEYFFGQYINSLSVFIILPPWIIINVADIHSTLFGLRNGSKEGNPLSRWFMEKFGTKKGLVIGKFIIVTPITFLIIFLDLGKNIIAACTMVMILVVIWNYCLSLSLKYFKKKNNQTTAAPNYPEG